MRRDPKIVTPRWLEYRRRMERTEKAHAKARAAAVPKPKPMSPSELVQAAEHRFTPNTLQHLTRIANDPKRDAGTRVKAATLILKRAYGEAENAD